MTDENTENTDNTENNEEEKHICPHCNEEKPTSRGLKIHITKIHSKEIENKKEKENKEKELKEELEKRKEIDEVIDETKKKIPGLGKWKKSKKDEPDKRVKKELKNRSGRKFQFSIGKEVYSSMGDFLNEITDTKHFTISDRNLNNLEKATNYALGEKAIVNNPYKAIFLILLFSWGLPLLFNFGKITRAIKDSFPGKEKKDKKDSGLFSRKKVIDIKGNELNET